MDPLRWKKIKSIFEDVLAKPEPQRKLFLDQACASDEDLRTEISSLLESHTMADRFLEPPEPATPDNPDPYIGKHFGPYRIDGLLGHGGMGAVYKAVRDDGQFQKQVAVKLVRPGAWSKELALRFQEERRTLARLEHPNIASLLDGGTTDDDVPYLVMEYVNGVPIDEYCDGAKLSLEERLQLFRTVCSAVQFAHQNLVVHRDIKPGNILVTPDGAPKLLDFGIARLLSDEQQTEPGEMTRVGLRFVTFEYACPEQVMGEAITTASDVYSLGVLLYKLLTGRRPYTFRSRLPHEITRVVCEQEPLKPSARILKDEEKDVDTTTRTASPEEMSSLRASSPKKLHRHLSGDLDNIVLKALQKDPLRRYGSVEQLSEDIRRHMHGLPVIARQDTFAYRGTKFLKRHAIVVTATLVVVLALVGGIIGVLWQANRARTEAEKATQVNMFLQEMLAAADPAQSGKDVTVAQLLDKAVDRIDNEFRGQPELQLSALKTICETYVALGLYARAGEQAQKAYIIAQDFYGEQHPEVARVLGALAFVSQRTGQYTIADSLYTSAVAMYRKTMAHSDKNLAGLLGDWGTLLHSLGDNDRALPLLKEASAMCRAVAGPLDIDYARSLSNLGPALQDAHELAAAESAYSEALHIQQQVLGAQHIDISYTMNNLAFVFINRGQLDSAEAMFRQSLSIRRKALGLQHPEYAAALSNLAAALMMEGKLDEAEKLSREGYAIFRTTVGSENIGRSVAAFTLGRATRLKGDPKSAEPLLRESLAIRKAILPGGHPAIVKTQIELGNCLAALKRFTEAESTLNAAYQSFQLSVSDGSAARHESLQALKDLYVAWGKMEKAREYQAKLDKLWPPQDSPQ